MTLGRGRELGGGADGTQGQEWAHAGTSPVDNKLARRDESHMHAGIGREARAPMKCSTAKAGAAAEPSNGCGKRQPAARGQLASCGLKRAAPLSSANMGRRRAYADGDLHGLEQRMRGDAAEGGG